MTEFDVYVNARDYDAMPKLADEALRRAIDNRLRVLRLSLVEVRETRAPRRDEGLCVVRTVIGEDASNG